MRVRAVVAGVIALGLVPGCSPSAPAGAPKGNTVKSYEQAAAVTAVAWSPAGDRLALAYHGESRIDLWEGTGKKLLYQLEGHRSPGAPDRPGAAGTRDPGL